MDKTAERLTVTQARVIYEIARENGHGPESSFAPLEIYPAHTRADYEARIALQQLVSLGLVEMVLVPEGLAPKQVVIGRDGKHYRLRITDVALAVYDLWVLTSSSEELNLAMGVYSEMDRQRIIHRKPLFVRA